MNDYDFSTLNDKEFENITIDLISRDRDKRFERFKAGRDGGIDGRYYGEDGKEEIIQCKHYLKTGYKNLISSLKSKKNGQKSEADKVKLLNPEKYIFVTSLPLSASNKKEIREIFKPYIKKDSDIYSQEDLNDLLKANSDIEDNHYKLWISSTTVLQRIFNNAIKGRSEFLLDEIKDKIKYYVMTQNHHKAIEKLEKSHTIIIAGEPGIGKSTLAEQISLFYIEKEFEFCVIAKDISEAEAIFDRDKKQIFYFDDFLGSNYLNALEAHTDSSIMRFITRIKRDKDKRFILTSRTNIFNQSLLLSDNFRTKKIDSDEFIIRVDDLEEIDKAKILYNHIWHSNLNEEYIDELYREERYKKVIKHKNFNPRLIEFITDIEKIKSSLANNYWQDIENNLNNPSEIWRNTFDEQSDEFIRNIVALVVFNEHPIQEKELKKAYYKLNDLMKLQNTSHNNKEFDTVIKKTVKYFLYRIFYNEKIFYVPFNPSISDFILNRYSNNEKKLTLLFLSLITRNLLFALKNLYSNSLISKKVYQNILLTIFEKIDISTINDVKEIDHFIQLIYIRSEDDTIKIELSNQEKNKIISFYQRQIDNPIKITDIYKFIYCFTNIESNKFNINSYKFISIMIETSSTLDEVNKIIELISYLEIKDKDILQSINNLVHEYLIETLKKTLEESLTDDNITYIHSQDFIERYIEEEIYFQYLDILIEEIEDTNNLLDINSEKIIFSIDKGTLIDSLINDFFDDRYDFDDLHSKVSSSNSNSLGLKSNINNITDLFQRD